MKKKPEIISIKYTADTKDVNKKLDVLIKKLERVEALQEKISKSKV